MDNFSLLVFQIMNAAQVGGNWSDKQLILHLRVMNILTHPNSSLSLLNEVAT